MKTNLKWLREQLLERKWWEKSELGRYEVVNLSDVFLLLDLQDRELREKLDSMKVVGKSHDWHNYKDDALYNFIREILGEGT